MGGTERRPGSIPHPAVEEDADGRDVCLWNLVQAGKAGERREPRMAPIGAKIGAARTAQGLSLSQIADSTGLSKGFLSRVERDDTSPSVATLVRLCHVLSVPVGALFAEPDVHHASWEDPPHINLGGVDADETAPTTRRVTRAVASLGARRAFARRGRPMHHQLQRRGPSGRGGLRLSAAHRPHRGDAHRRHSNFPRARASHLAIAEPLIQSAPESVRARSASYGSQRHVRECA